MKAIINLRCIYIFTYGSQADVFSKKFLLHFLITKKIKLDIYPSTYEIKM